MSFDFDAAVIAPFRMQPGLRRLAPGATQLTPSRPGGRHLREKLAVLSSYPAQALLAAPSFDPAPALQALTEQAEREHPDLLRAITELPEVRACVAALPAEWRRAGLLSLAFEEDFAIVDAETGTIPWLAVALPSHWAPEHKVGRPFAEVHAPVADNQLIVAASGHLTRLVTGSERWERFVWTISRHPRLHAHPARLDPAPWPHEADADTIASIASWRTERQTFIPLPDAKQAVFTIHVQLQPLADAMSPERAARVHAALASMSDAVLAYRGLAPVRDRLLDWLARRALA
jgi:hypothetical protein